MRRATVFATFALMALVGLPLLAWFAYTALAPGASSAAPTGNLTCSVKATCDGGEVEVFRMSSLSNAQAGTPTGSAYGWPLCCGGVTDLAADCTGAYDVALAISGTDNAHAAVDGSYSTDVCLSVGAEGIVNCASGTTCDPGFACLATLSATTNAHVADCDGVDDYATKVCCEAFPDNCPDEPNPGQENADADQWGDACDYCSSTATAWYVPAGDDDCDGFTTAIEGYLGTDPQDACPDGPSDDAWPLDINIDGQVSVVADVLNFRGRVGVTSGDPNWWQRLDLNTDGQITVVGDVLMYRGMIGQTCT